MFDSYSKVLVWFCGYKANCQREGVKLKVGLWFKTNCPLMGPGSIAGVPSVGVFLRDPSPYLHRLTQIFLDNFIRNGIKSQILTSLSLKIFNFL